MTIKALILRANNALFPGREVAPQNSHQRLLELGFNPDKIKSMFPELPLQ
jgi:Fe2+ transport system protein FeoA